MTAIPSLPRTGPTPEQSRTMDVQIEDQPAQPTQAESVELTVPRGGEFSLAVPAEEAWLSRNWQVRFAADNRMALKQTRSQLVQTPQGETQRVLTFQVDSLQGDTRSEFDEPTLFLSYNDPGSDKLLDGKIVHIKVQGDSTSKSPQNPFKNGYPMRYAAVFPVGSPTDVAGDEKTIHVSGIPGYGAIKIEMPESTQLPQQWRISPLGRLANVDTDITAVEPSLGSGAPLPGDMRMRAFRIKLAGDELAAGQQLRFLVNYGPGPGQPFPTLDEKTLVVDIPPAAH